MNTKMQTKKAKRGFTITELVIVIAVIAILAAVLIPTFSNVINRANESAALQESRSEYDNFRPETILSDDTTVGDDYLFVYKNGEDYFVVIDGVFYTDPATIEGTVSTDPATEFTYKIDTNTTKNCTVGAKVGNDSGTALTGYDIQNDNITIYVLTVTVDDATAGG